MKLAVWCAAQYGPVALIALAVALPYPQPYPRAIRGPASGVDVMFTLYRIKAPTRLVTQ